jgi:hypothetical protein
MKRSKGRSAGREDAIVLLCVHGVGQSLDRQWIAPWREALTGIFAQDFPGREVRVEAADYHDLFDDSFSEDDLDPIEYARALVSLGWSGFQHGLPEVFRTSRGIDSLSETLKWTAGMVVRWTSNADLRTELRDHLAASIDAHQPHAILAHSLGSLIAYDTFFYNGGLVADRSFVSFGSQIGNPFVRNVYHGRLKGLPTARRWFHLYNPEDDVFTAQIRLHGADVRRAGPHGEVNFKQIATPFDNPDPLDHAVVSRGPGTVGYLDHYATRRIVWPEIAGRSRASTRLNRSVRRLMRKALDDNKVLPDHRALLIGVDRYAHPSIRPLDGCVNDTFLVSSVLQELGMPVQNIRLLHNERATASAIRDRLEWLLDDFDPGEFRTLYFSGHGHRLESYGVGEIADRLDECLCPHDYDFTTSTAIIDDFIHDLYAQLPYDSQFVIGLDCCHSGGMSRSGQASVRGITSPLDIAHRGLEWIWDAEKSQGRWSPRTPPSDPRAAATTSPRDAAEARKRFLLDARVTLPPGCDAEAFIGKNRSLRRIGRALSLRASPESGAVAPSRKADATGPYLPVILQACAEDDVALEHTDGATVQGAFTFALVRALRAHFVAHRSLDWRRLQEETTAELDRLRYPQRPQFLYAEGQRKMLFGEQTSR